MAEAPPPPPVWPVNGVIRLDLIWDRIDKSVDVDASCCLFDCYGMLVDCAFYNNLVACYGAVQHGGDSKDGAAEGVDEYIVLKLGELPPNVCTLIFTVTCHSGGSFASVETARVFVVDAPSNQPVQQFQLGCRGAHTALLIASVTRLPNGAGWQLLQLGTPAAGQAHTFMDLLPEMQRLLNVDPVMAAELKRQTPVFQLEKGECFVIPGNMETVRMGLGWDTQVDLDASVVLLSPTGAMLDHVNFSNLKSNDESIQHAGDNTTGKGTGDDEKITVQLRAVNPAVSDLYFTVNVYSSGSYFNQVKGAYCRLYDASPAGNNRELCRFNLSDTKLRKNGLVFAVLQRDRARPGFWNMHAIGEHADGNTYADLVDECQAFQKHGPRVPPPKRQPGGRPATATAPAGGGAGPLPLPPATTAAAGPLRPVEITIASGAGLVACDRGGTSDPFCKVTVSLGATVVTKYETQVVKKTVSPAWNETFAAAAPPTATLKVHVWDYDRMKNDDMGSAEVELGRVLAAGELQLPLTGKKAAGHVVVRARLKPE